MAWLKDCEICNVGLCNTVNDLKDKGLSENAVCNQMSEESEGLYSKEAIRARYRHHTGKTKRSVGENHQHPIKPTMSDEDKELFQLCAEINRIKKALQRVNPKKGSDTYYVDLKGAKRGFNRTVDEFPGEGTEKQLFVWKAYFECTELHHTFYKISRSLYDHLPEELPENRSKPKKKKPRSN